MKHLLLACVLFVLGIACKSPDSGRGSSQAVVARAQGSAEILQNNSWQPVRLGQVLNEGDQARTGADGQIDLRITPHGGVMTLMPNSAMQIEQLGPNGK